jgi:two-component system response regulator RstA
VAASREHSIIQAIGLAAIVTGTLQTPDRASAPDPRPMVRPPTIRVGSLRIDVLRRTARLADATYQLTGSTLGLLYLLGVNVGRVLSRNEIRDALWPADRAPSSNAVDRLVVELRRRLDDDAAHPRLVETVAGRGYRFAATRRPSDR